MAKFLQRLKQRKLVQWAITYLAAGWVLLQALLKKYAQYRPAAVTPGTAPSAAISASTP